MKKLIEVQSKCIIVCDNKECNYELDYSGEDLIKFIGKQCPNCGQNLLTIEDYLMHERMIKIINFINKWFSWITLFVRKSKFENVVSVHYHDGKTTIENK